MWVKRFWQGLAVVLAAVVLAACSGAGSGPEGTARAFTKAVYAGDADAALDLLHWPDDKAVPAEVIRGKLAPMIATGKTLAETRGGVDEIEVSEVKINPQDENRATARVVVRFKNGETESENTSLIKVDGKWKIEL